MAVPTPNKREVAQLVVVVLEAQNLDEKLATADIYCVCDLSNSAKGETSTRRGHEPVWDKEFRMKVYEVDGEQRPLLKVALMQAKDGEDELLGQGYVAIDGKWKDNEFDDWIDLKLNGKYTGQLFLEMTYYPATLPPAPVQRRPSKLDKRNNPPFRMPLPADNPSGRFNPSIRPRIQQMQGSGPLSHAGGNGARPAVPHKSVKAQAFVAPSAMGVQPQAHVAPTKKTPALPLPGDPEPPEIPSFLRPGRPAAQTRTSEEGQPSAHQPQPAPAPSIAPPPHQTPHPQQHQQVYSQHHHPQAHGQPQSQLPPSHPSAAAGSHAQVSPPPVQHSQSDPRLSTQQGSLVPQARQQRQQAQSMPLAEVRPAPSPSPSVQLPVVQQHQQAPWSQEHQHHNERRRQDPSGPTVSPAPAIPVSVLGGISSAASVAPPVFTEAPLPYQTPQEIRPHPQQYPSTPHIQVQTTGATFPAVIPQGPYSPEQVLPPPHQHHHVPPARHSPSPSPSISHAPPHTPSPAPSPHLAPIQGQRWSTPAPQLPHQQPYTSVAPPAFAPAPSSVPHPVQQVVPNQRPPSHSPQPQQFYAPPPPTGALDHHRRASFTPPVVPSSPYRPPTIQPQHPTPQQHLRTQQISPQRSPSPDFGDSVPMPGSFQGDAAPPRPPKAPLAPPLPPPPPSRSPSPPLTPPRRPRDHTPPRAATPQLQQGRTKVEEYEREREVERERRRSEERSRAHEQGRRGREQEDDEDRFHDAELPPPIYSHKPPTAAEKGKGPARPESRDSSPAHVVASTSAAAVDSNSADFSASRIHAGQAALALRFQQEREDARMAAALARENDEREAAERKERERRADEEFARMMKEEERLREQREREDEELAKRMAEEGTGEEEERRERERRDEELARSLAEAA